MYGLRTRDAARGELFPIHLPRCVFALFLQPARFEAMGMPEAIFVGQNGTHVQFNTPEIQDDDLFSSRTVSIAVFSSTKSGTILGDDNKKQRTLPIDKLRNSAL